MLDKKHNSDHTNTNPLVRNPFFYTLVIFNLLFLTYIFTLGYYNRLAWDDYAFLGHLRDHGFLSPFTFWYSHWQGRFGPQFFINSVLTIYKIYPNLLFYTVLISSLFIYSIYQILKLHFPISKWVLINYSIFLFCSLVLTTFEFNTFYLLNVSTMYFGGVLFALLGTSFLLNKNYNFFQYLVIAFCFLYVGSSSEHAGILATLVLGMVLLYNLHKSSYSLASFLSIKKNQKTLTAFFFCVAALIIMILAPGNEIRMSQFQQVTNVKEILRISYNSTVQILYHIFYKIPYIFTLIFPFLLFGISLKEKIQIKKTNPIYLFLLCVVVLWLLIFMSNVPVSYAIGTVGPIRSYVFISFFLVALLCFLCVHIGFHYLSNSIINKTLAGISVVILFAFVAYSFNHELPLIRKYHQTDKSRVSLLNKYKAEKWTESVFLQPLYNPKYITITDWFRIITNTYHLPTDMTDTPLFVGDIGEVPDWRNNHIKLGLGLDFQIILSHNEELSKAEMDSIKLNAETAYETSKFKFYILDNFIYYQIHPPSFDKFPSYIYCRIEPALKTVLKSPEEQKLFFDFLISDQRIKFKGDVTGYENYIFIKKEITKFPIKKLETGFYESSNGMLEYSNGMEIQFVQNF